MRLKVLSNHIKTLLTLVLFAAVAGCSSFSQRELEKKWFSTGEEKLLAEVKAHGIDQTISSLQLRLKRKAALEEKKALMRHAWFLYSNNRTNKNAALAAAQAVYLVIDVLDNKDEVYQLSELGYKITLSAGAGKDSEASYYNALFLGFIVRQKGLMALGRLKDVVSMLEVAKKKPELDFGGPMRVQGMLFLKAPPWPRGLGDLDKALEALEAAFDKSPRFPQNTMFLAEALIEDEEFDKAGKLLKKASAELKPEVWGEDYCRIWKEYINNLKKKMK